MTFRFLKTIAAASLLVGTAAAQTCATNGPGNPDVSANNTLKGDYFVREVLMTGGINGTITTAASVTGVATFDGNCTYTFKGQGYTLASGANASLSLTGTYMVGSNGFFAMTSLADPTDIDFGGVSPVGPNAFVASATELNNVTMLIGIPAGANATNGSFKGSYTGGAIDFPGANINAAREASFGLSPDGAGNLGTVTLSGAGADLGGTALSQPVSGVTYSLSGEGSGTITFGAAASSQLVSGSKTLYISADGNIIMGGSPTGFDMLVGIRSLTGPASNATAANHYYMTALEDEVDTTGQTVNLIDAYYGSLQGLGTGVALFHNRFQSLQIPVYDYTADSQFFNVGSNGVIPFGGDTPYQYTFGVNGQAYVAIGDAVNYAYYSLTLGLAMPNYSGGGVYLYPNGIVNAANFAPITNPVAPNELISLNGTGLAAAPVSATTLPLPTTLGGVQVKINGIAAPLDYVSPTQIIALMPSSINPYPNGVYYATIQVINNNVGSNSVVVYTSDTAPGVFASPIAIGPAAAQHANYTVISASNPANIGETVILYAGGLGAVNPPVSPDGAPAPSNPLSQVTDTNLSVDFSGNFATYPVPFAGLTPTTAGLYQIDIPIPTGTSSNVYVDVATTDGYTSQATMSVAGAASIREATTADAKQALQQRLARNKTREKRKAAVPARSRILTQSPAEARP
jgi:uncharacterized protein (TIGR03437 family)